jgi:hypothetical protein
MFFEASNSKLQFSRIDGIALYFRFGDWNFIGAWMLEFGISERAGGRRAVGA